jgi:hypothetical protein
MPGSHLPLSDLCNKSVVELLALSEYLRGRAEALAAELAALADATPATPNDGPATRHVRSTTKRRRRARRR